MCDIGVSDSRAFADEPFFSIFFFQYSRLVLAFRKVVGLAFGHLFFVCVCTDLPVCIPRLPCCVNI